MSLQNLNINYAPIRFALKSKSPIVVAQDMAYRTDHPDYQLGAGILIMKEIENQVKPFDEYLEQVKDRLNDNTYQFMKKNIQVLKTVVEQAQSRNYTYSIHAVETFKKSYLLKEKGVCLETPQYLFMRVASGIWFTNLERCIETFEALSTKMIVHASPTLANCGLKNNTVASCFLLQMEDDTVSIMDNLKWAALISKGAGGLGIGLGRIRHSQINHKGMSSGVVPIVRMIEGMIKTFNQTGMREGACKVTLPTWHVDLLDFIEMKRNVGKEELRARFLHYSIWVQNLFMVRAIRDEQWSLFCPNQAKGLNDVCGDEFDKLYTQYEQDQSIPRTTISARSVLEKICHIQAEVGEPFLMFDDLVNFKSSHKHMGHITNSNLCQEITLFCKPDEQIAVCNLGSLIIDSFWNEEKKSMNWELLGQHTRIMVRNLNRVIDINDYSVEQTRRGNEIQRPIGLGILGLADLFVKAGLPYESDEALQLTEQISACMYYHGVSESVDLVQTYGIVPCYEGSTWQRGEFQFDLWNKEVEQITKYGQDMVELFKKSGREIKEPVSPQQFGVNDTWEKLRERVKFFGIANSHLFCQMPNASTGHISQRNEAIEPIYRLLFKKNGLSGEYLIMNTHMVKRFEEKGIWQQEELRKKIVQYLVEHDGSIQGISKVLQKDVSDMEQLFKTSFEISQKKLCALYAARGRYICNSQSLNVYMKNPTKDKLIALHTYNWVQGNKTSSYYLRSQSEATSQKIMLKDEGCLSCQ